MDAAAVVAEEGGPGAALGRYVEILTSRGIEWGLIGPREADRLWDRHVLNSLAIEPFVPAGARVLDVGSGAGLPGVPLALARPDVTVTLLEPLLRRWRFLVGVVEELGLGARVEARRGRAEECSGVFDVVTCRAVAPLATLVGWCAGLVADGGRLVVLKGRSAASEVASAKKAFDELGWSVAVHEVVPTGCTEPTWVIAAGRGVSRETARAAVNGFGRGDRSRKSTVDSSPTHLRGGRGE